MTTERFKIEPQYQMHESCRCFGCLESTGKWEVKDLDDVYETKVFDTEQEAIKWVKVVKTWSKIWAG